MNRSLFMKHSKNGKEEYYGDVSRPFLQDINSLNVWNINIIM